VHKNGDELLPRWINVVVWSLMVDWGWCLIQVGGLILVA
jgi:hypothetical protein